MPVLTLTYSLPPLSSHTSPSPTPPTPPKTAICFLLAELAEFAHHLTLADHPRTPVATLCYAGMGGGRGGSERGDVRKQRKRVENAAIFAIGLLAFITAFPSTVYVHENAHQWEAPAVLVSLGLGVLPILWYWRMRRYGWVAAILSALFLTFSFTSALFHGWEAQASALVSVGLVIGAAFIFIGMARVTRRVESAMRTVGEDLGGDPLFRRETLFHDDGQRIIEYPRRRRLVLSCVAQAALLTGIGCAAAFLRTNDPLQWPVIGLAACALLAGWLATLYRLVIRRPSLVVGPDGIFDSGTLIWSGVGLVRWDEILAVFPDIRSSGGVKNHFLTIIVTDLPAIRKRLPLLKRLALRGTYSSMSQLLIPQSLLEAPVDDLAAQIARYVEAHAPPGWREGKAEDDAPTLDHEQRKQ